jgi:hypothetical protein
MESSPSTSDALNLSDGPDLLDNELGVHIIYVPDSRGGGHTGAAAMSQIASQIGKPDPTDIVVFGGQPWHSAGLPGHKKEPKQHPKVHDDFPETILKISIKDRQKAVWWSEEEFTITSIRLTHQHQPQHPCYPEAATIAAPYPFADGPPAPPTRIEEVNGRNLYVARSTVPIAASVGHMYKMEFSMAGKRIDPDMYCAP